MGHQFLIRKATLPPITKKIWDLICQLPLDPMYSNPVDQPTMWNLVKELLEAMWATSIALVSSKKHHSNECNMISSQYLGLLLYFNQGITFATRHLVPGS